MSESLQNNINRYCPSIFQINLLICSLSFTSNELFFLKKYIFLHLLKMDQFVEFLVPYDRACYYVIL